VDLKGDMSMLKFIQKVAALLFVVFFVAQLILIMTSTVRPPITYGIIITCLAWIIPEVILVIRDGNDFDLI